MLRFAPMLTVAEAQSAVIQQLRPLASERTTLSLAALGLVLQEDVVGDLDMPPFDKALMDGYAVRCADLPEGRARLTIVEEIVAGSTPSRSLRPGEAARIMTGAPVPPGADAVVVVERTEALPNDRVAIADRPPRCGQNIVRRAAEMKEGEIVLRAGAVLRPPEFGLLATVGRLEVRVVPAPRVAIIATGDELVEAGMKPHAGQIRNGNGPMLVAQTARSGGLPRYLGIAGDHADSLRGLIEEGLRADVLLLTGGVSAGKLDLVPALLQEAGVTTHFHKVALKPGKPAFFGMGPRGNAVFGLPGNPVSSFVCFELFVRPALRRLAGHAEVTPQPVSAALAADFAHRSDRPTYHPAWLDETAEGRRVQPVAWLGSHDLRSLSRSNALVVLPPGDVLLNAGCRLEVLRT